jgi:hypothetical protein
METIRFTAVVDDNQVIRPPAGVVLPHGELEVVVRPLTSSPENPPAGKKPSLQEVMAVIRERQRQRGFKPPTREEVDEYLRAERDGWED